MKKRRVRRRATKAKSYVNTVRGLRESLELQHQESFGLGSPGRNVHLIWARKEQPKPKDRQIDTYVRQLSRKLTESQQAFRASKAALEDAIELSENLLAAAKRLEM